MVQKEQVCVLAVNAGSSSVKASVLDGDERVASFEAERLGSSGAVLRVFNRDVSSSIELSDSSHASAIKHILDQLEQRSLIEKIIAIGHRVVHGGTEFDDSVRIDSDTLQKIDDLSYLAPLHNPNNVASIRACLERLPDTAQFAVFDTSFHVSSIPPHAATLPLPEEYRSAGVRKYGFHGTSVKYVADKASRRLRELSSSYKGSRNSQKRDYNMIVAHIGNGASVTAVAGSKSVETSMGFTPASGLMMGTRAGSVDPAIVGFAIDHLGKSPDDVLSDLNMRSGLAGMTGKNDMRDVLDLAASEKDGNKTAQLAVDMFAYRISSHVAASTVALPGKLDAIVFTAGIGEHSAVIRQKCIDRLKPLLGIELDAERNAGDGARSGGVLTPDGAWPPVLDIATDEEAMIASDCLRLLQED